MLPSCLTARPSRCDENNTRSQIGRRKEEKGRSQSSLNFGTNLEASLVFRSLRKYIRAMDAPVTMPECATESESIWVEGMEIDDEPRREGGREEELEALNAWHHRPK